MLKRKAFSRIFFTTLIFFVVFVMYSLGLTDNNVKHKNSPEKNEKLCTINDDNYVSCTLIYVGKVFTLEDKIKEKLEIMVHENNKNSLLPSYFNPILPENTEVLKVKVINNMVKVYFSEHLNDITKDQSEKMIEAIVYTITDEDILGIEIYVDNKLLKYVPHTKKQLPALLTKDFGINKVYEVFKSDDISKLIMYYYTYCKNDYCLVPITKYVNSTKEKLEIIFDEYLKLNGDRRLISMLENVHLNSYKIEKDTIIIDIDTSINKEEIELLTKTIFDNYDVSNIRILVNGTLKYKKSQKTLEN